MDLVINRKLTKAFIDFLPSTVFLTPQTKVKKPGGGYVLEAGTPRDALVVTIIEQNNLAGSPRGTATVDGVERAVEFELLAEWGAPVALRDTFTHRGLDWEVVGVFYDNQYETRVLVSARG